MKKMKRFVSLLAAAALLAILPNANVLTVSAAEPATYVITYDNDAQDWRYQAGSTWSEETETRELYYLQQSIKDGDAVVIEGACDGNPINLDVNLGNLTLKNAATVIITAKSINDCFILGGSVAAVNGNINNAYVYDNGSCTFNNNINTLQLFGSDDIHTSATVAGTVAHVIAKGNNGNFYECYNVAAGKLEIEDGSLRTDAAHYSTTGSAPADSNTQANAQTNTQSGATQAAASQNQTTSKPSDSEYDDVPKTGEDNSAYLWLFGIAAVCLTGKTALKKSA